MELQSVIEEFMADRRTHCAQHTLHWYTYMLVQLRSSLGKRELTSITAADLKTYIAYQRNRPRADLRRGPMSKTTTAGHVRAVKALFRFCLTQGLIDVDASASLRAPRIQQVTQALTPAQLQTVLIALERADWEHACRDRALVLFLLDSGCRANEVMGLGCEQVNLAEGYAQVLGKGDKVRRVGLSMHTVAALAAYLGERQAGPVFQTAEKGCLCRTALREILRRLSRRVGIHLHPHLFRSTMGTMMVADGADPSHVQTLMGHANIASTYIYVEAARERAALKAHRQHSPVRMSAGAVK